MAKETGATELDLSRMNLAALPPEIGQLAYLQTLDVSSNALSSLPREMGQHGNLEQLHLRGNPLASPLPHVVEEGTVAIVEYLRAQEGAASDE